MGCRVLVFQLWVFEDMYFSLVALYWVCQMVAVMGCFGFFIGPILLVVIPYSFSHIWAWVLGCDCV